MTKITFIASVFLIMYGYFGYPLSLIMIGYLFGKKRHVRNNDYTPYVTLITTVHNEEKRVRRKLEDTLRLAYPRERLQVIIASDGSTDKTNDIVREFEKNGVELLEITMRAGKENAQKAAIPHSKGDIIVFSDVATLLNTNALSIIVSNFADSSVGSVSSEDRLKSMDSGSPGEGMYLRYEMWLRRLESDTNSLVGLSGSFFAARKEICTDFSGDMQSDFRTVLNTVKLGMRAIVDTQVIGHYQNVAHEKDEFARKIRTVLRGLTVLSSHMEYLNPKRYGIFSYQLFCHKLLRWLVPAFMCMALLSNLLLLTNSIWFLILFIFQLAFYALAFCGWKWGTSLFGVLTKIPTYFVTVNLAILAAWLKFIHGERIVMWTPTER